MIETLTLITLCMLYLIFLRPGKTPPLKKSLVIDHPGKYHITLAPHLNLAQPFIEAIAQQLVESQERSGDSATQFFEVRDKQVTAHGHEAYLLAITQRDGIILFQATAPSSGSGHLQTISGFAHRVLARFPLSDEPQDSVNQKIASIVQQVASARHVQLDQILPATMLAA